MNILRKSAGSLFGVAIAVATFAWFKPNETYQQGAAGVGMELVETKKRLAEKLVANEVPAPLPSASPGGPLAVNAYKNVQVLGHLTAADFTRQMTALTTWVSPNEGCGYCHAPQRDAAGKVVVNEDGYPQADLNNMQSDELYTKRVARRMIQMTHRINADWKLHVQNTGVTCYTCHHGNPVPVNIWYDPPPSITEDRMVGRRAEQNAPSTNAALASLPDTSFRPFLASNENIRVVSTDALGADNNRASVKQTEWTYGLMMHMSTALGVNCTYCHNTRSMGAWSTSPVTRTTAWYGIRMVREINLDYLEPLAGTFPDKRLGPTGDVPKANCATCHAGAYKPLLGVSMLKDYPALAGPQPQPPKTENLNDPALVGDGGVPSTAPPAPESLSVTPADAGAVSPSDAGPGSPSATQPRPTGPRIAPSGSPSARP